MSARRLCILATLLWKFIGTAIAQDVAIQSEEKIKAGADEPASFSGFLYGAMTRRELERNLNSANGPKVPTHSAAVAGILEIRHGAFWGRARFEEERLRTPRTGTPDNPWASKGQAEITQLSLKLPLSEQVEFTAGRLNLSFDDGQSFHPLDFLEDAVRATEVEDRAGRYRGFPLLMISRVDSGSSYRLIYSDDTIYQGNYSYTYGHPNPGFNRGLRQWITSARWSADQLTGTILYQRPSSGNAGIGASARYVQNASLSFHGSFFTVRGNSLPLHRNVFLGRSGNLNGTDVYINESPVKSWRADDSRRYLRWLVGATYTSEPGTTYVFELWRDDRGMNKNEQNTWENVVRFHNGLSNSAARAINLAYDLESLRSSHGTQAFLRISMPMPNHASFQPSLLLSTRDGSGTTNLRWIQRLDEKWEYGLEAWLRFGRAYSQFKSTPDKSGVLASIRYFF